MTKEDQAARVRELRAEMLDGMAERAERGFRDTRFDALRPLRRRRLLVVATAVALALYAVGLAFESLLLLTAPALLLAIGGMVLLRFATRNVMDLPDEFVDERMRAVRGERYRYAYIGAVTLVSLDVALQLVAQLAPDFAGQLDGDPLDAALVLFLAIMALPGAIHAWLEPEV